MSITRLYDICGKLKLLTVIPQKKNYTKSVFFFLAIILHHLWFILLELYSSYVIFL